LLNEFFVVNGDGFTHGHFLLENALCQKEIPTLCMVIPSSDSVHPK